MVGSRKGKGIWGFYFFFFCPDPPWREAGGLVKSGGRVGFQPATEFAGSEGGGGWQPSIPLHSLKEFWPLRAALPRGKLGGSSPPHLSLLFVSLSPRALVLEGLFHHTNDVTHLGAHWL